jgi:CheY-like chemotaxis protein
LIVEDEVRLASALQRGLSVEGFTVDVAHTGPDGLHAANETSYDAIILDIMLPDLSGYRIIERLRAMENWVPILMLTAKDGEYDEADALDLGADDYLTKPFSFVIDPVSPILCHRPCVIGPLVDRSHPPTVPAGTSGQCSAWSQCHVRILGPVKAWSVPQRYRALRWLVPITVLGLVSVGGLAATGTFSTTSASSESLPDTTPTALVAALDSAKVSGFSGTIVARMSLGLPDVGPLADERDSESMASLLSGAHTVRLWYGGPDRQRVALLGATSESDLFRSGNDLWEWNSATKVAVHMRIGSSQHGPTPVPTPGATSPGAALQTLSPTRLAHRLLQAMGPSTGIEVHPGRVVAGRSTYELTLTPRTPETRVASVRIEIDGKAKVPLSVRVYARGSSTPSIDVAFTSITFKMPSASYFEFSPPPGATVHSAAAGGPPASPRALTRPESPGTARASGATGPAESSASAPTISTSGHDWTSVVEYRISEAQRHGITSLLDQLPAVSGSWGSGRLLSSPLLCALVTDDGRVFAGSVDPSALYAAARAGR